MTLAVTLSPVSALALVQVEVTRRAVEDGPQSSDG